MRLRVRDCIGGLFVSPHRILKREESCVCVSVRVCMCACGLEWRKGWRWGLHPKKGFLSRWQSRDWQRAILLGNSVSQPVSLPVQQPLTPLNLAFCCAVTGLVQTLHVAGLINCTTKHWIDTKWPRWTPRAIILWLEATAMELTIQLCLVVVFCLLSGCVVGRSPAPAPGPFVDNNSCQLGLSSHCMGRLLRARGGKSKAKSKSLQHFLSAQCKSFPTVTVRG